MSADDGFLASAQDAETRPAARPKYFFSIVDIANSIPPEYSARDLGHGRDIATTAYIIDAFLGNQGLLRPDRHHRRNCSLIGLTGSVAVGKSEYCRRLKAYLEGLARAVNVEVISTDCFLYSNRELESKGMMDRKGFPESYDADLMCKVIGQIIGGADGIEIPIYSHEIKDIDPRQRRILQSAAVYIFEGVNIHAKTLHVDGGLHSIGDLMDLTVSMDAEHESIRRWYTDRAIKNWHIAVRSNSPHWSAYTKMSLPEFRQELDAIWRRVNAPLYDTVIAPNLSRSDIIFMKGESHQIESAAFNDRAILRRLFGYPNSLIPRAL